jgi:hypothetical protein
MHDIVLQQPSMVHTTAVCAAGMTPTLAVQY